MSDSHEEMSAISESQMYFAGVLAYACTIPGTIVCGLVLIAYAVVAYFPRARKQLDRVSFRLLVQALIFNVLFGIAYAWTPMTAGRECDFGAFAVNFTLSFATFYTACIAVNLQLVLVHGVNGRMMEKYYVIVTMLLSCALNIPTYALGQFGWNALSETCWYSNADDRTRLRWIIATQSFWISLAAVIETICSCIVLFWLYRYQSSINSLTRDATSSVPFKCDRSERARTSWFTSASMSTTLTRDPKLRKVIMRIALYPIVSLIFNFGTVSLDLHMSIVRVETQLDFRLLVLDLVLYGTRPFAYGLLAFWDPSFVNGVQEVRHAWSLFSSRSRTNLKFATTQITTDDGKLFVDVEKQKTPTSSEASQGTSTSDETGNIKVLSPSDGRHQGRSENKGQRPSQEDQERQSIERQL